VKFNKSGIFGSLIPEKEKAKPHVIPPSWRPDGIKNIDVE
jgi:hypothetical protein